MPDEVTIKETWRKVRPEETSMGCIQCGKDTAIVRQVETPGLPVSCTCYCEHCSPVVFLGKLPPVPKSWLPKGDPEPDNFDEC